MTAKDALARTVLLIRDFVNETEANDNEVVVALTSITVAIVADESIVTMPAAQTVIASLAAQVLASGARLRLVLPNVGMAAEQPPLRGAYLRDALIDYAGDLIPGGLAWADTTPSATDVVFLVGNTSASSHCSTSCRRVGWTKWSGVLATLEESVPTADTDLPVGPLVAATLGAAEAFKFAVRELMRASGVERAYDELAASTRVVVSVAPEETEVSTFDFGHIDMISGGAIANAFLHGLLRIPQARAAVRVFEPETLDLSNNNRYALARLSARGELKTQMVASWQTGHVTIVGEPIRFDERTPMALRKLAPTVLVGTDDIPSRWFVQRMEPTWLCIGATIHFTAMVSEHDANTPCAGCLHPEDDDVNAPVATVAFVSYWAGLLLLVRLLRKHSDRPVQDAERVFEVAALQAGEMRGVWVHPVCRNPRCPLKCTRAA